MEDTLELDISGTPPEISTQAQDVILNLLPQKSKLQYEKRHAEFIKWCELNKVKKFSENVLLAYFSKQFSTYKSSSLWSIFSMLKCTLRTKNNVDIGSYYKLIAFLKQKGVGYQPKKSKILTKEEILKFLQEAPDEEFLMMKVIFSSMIGGGYYNLIVHF
ncbi:hypothetical protein ABEB36_013983 [Hypothenemus hampei]|uniref:Uncharacterized protein n=1 Tax=Hypothenemus hampei TaxID=57062 RepID=A0ABD1E2Y0_HYPHA